MTDLLVFFGYVATLSAPLLLAALGGLLSERSGIVNIGLEGVMLSAACVAAIFGVSTQSPFIGVLGGLTVAVLVSLLHGLLTQAYGIDHIVSGMAINVLAIGATNYFSEARGDVSSERVPVLDSAVYWCIALLATIAVSVYLARTRGGLRLLAVGNDPEKSRQMGVDPIKIRYLALVGTGVLAGLGGVLIVSNAQRWSDNMVAGRGFIALAALILGGWRPWPTFGACLLFGALYAAQLRLKGSPVLGFEVPTEAWTALPYLVTVVALAGFLGRSKAPAGLGKP